MRTLRKIVAFAAAMAIGAVTQAVSFAQTPDRPAAIVSIAPLDRLMQDFTYLTRSAGVPQIGGIGSMRVEVR